MGNGELAFMPAHYDLPDDLPQGTRVFHGQYQITRLIGSGGFGLTYLARDSLDREVVLKECFADGYCRRSGESVRPRTRDSKAELDRFVRQFLKEARRLAQLSHPNIVGVHQVFEDNDTAYMALDFIRGHDLQAMIDRSDPSLSPGYVITMTRKLVAALAYVHDHDLLHCDIAPDNIFISTTREPILIDFGAARLRAQTPQQRNSGMIVVKDGFSPHELYFSGGNIGPWSDLYSLAATIYQVISGDAPKNSQTRLQAMVERMPDPLTPLAGRFPAYPAEFLESIDRAMEVMPAARFQSAGDWLAILDRLPPVPGLESVQVASAVSAQRQDVSPPEPKLPSGTVPQLPHAKPSRTSSIDLSALREVDGMIGACLVDGNTGKMLATLPAVDFDLATAALANCAVIQAQCKSMQQMGLDQSLDEVLITLGKQLHMIRPLCDPSQGFIYMVLQKSQANLGLARLLLLRVAQAVGT
jgi:serine/threonine protein kinase